MRRSLRRSPRPARLAGSSPRALALSGWPITPIFCDPSPRVQFMVLRSPSTGVGQVGSGMSKCVTTTADFVQRLESRLLCVHERTCDDGPVVRLRINATSDRNPRFATNASVRQAVLAPPRSTMSQLRRVTRVFGPVGGPRGMLAVRCPDLFSRRSGHCAVRIDRLRVLETGGQCTWAQLPLSALDSEVHCA
jgi:hypothetical protein